MAGVFRKEKVDPYQRNPLVSLYENIITFTVVYPVSMVAYIFIYFILPENISNRALAAFDPTNEDNQSPTTTKQAVIGLLVVSLVVILLVAFWIWIW